MSKTNTEGPNTTPTQAWWREHTMWLVVGGPSVVVVASFITLALALSHPDPVLDTSARAEADGAGKTTALQPAQKARNHAATGGQ